MVARAELERFAWTAQASIQRPIESFFAVRVRLTSLA